jgi:tetratricopeptide (TPR) repeat protein
MAASVVVAGVAAAAAIGLGGEPEVPLDHNLVAVAPIAVLDESFEGWSVGMGDFLSRTLDGAGPLSTIPPTTVGERAPDRLDAGSATELGRSTGAGLVVFGSLMPLRGDSVRANVTVVDASSGAPIGDLEVRDAVARMDQVLDSVAVGVLRQLGARGRVGAFPLWSLGSTSMTALKAFLRGEYAFRRTDWDSARAYYEQALEIDSGIVMAQFRLGFVYSLGEGDAGRAYAQFHRAGELNRGMSEHDSLIIESAAKMAALKLGLVPDSVEEDEVDDGFGNALRAATRFPEDAEAWYMVGLHRDYQQKRINSTPATTLEAYLLAVELDSGFGPVYQRAAQIAVLDGQLELAQRLAAQYLTLDPPVREMGYMLVIAKALDPAVPEAEVESLLDSLPDEVLAETFNNVMGIADSRETAIRIAREGLSRPHDQRFFFTTDLVLRRSLAGMLAYRGHMREAYEITGTEEESWFPTIFAELAVWGHVPEDVADSTFQAWLTADPYYPRYGIATAHWWLAARGDTAAIQTIIRKNADVARELSPYVALARRDTAEALQRFTELRDAEKMGFWDPLALSRLLVAQGRDSVALEVLKGSYTSQWPVPTRGYWALERARLADRMGDLETAIDSYQFVADVWLHADEELQPHVTEAREALRRLTVEPEGT